MKMHLEISDKCDVLTYDYGTRIGIKISSAADHHLAGKCVLHIEDEKELKDTLLFLKEDGLKIPI